jgi:hypothetical protein
MTNHAERRLTHQMRVVELRFGSPVPLLLHQLRREGLRASEVARWLDLPYGTVHRWLVRFGLDDASLVRRALHADGQGSATHEARWHPRNGPPAGGGVRIDLAPPSARQGGEDRSCPMT